MYKIALFFHAGSYNHGCEALARTITKLIRNNIENAKIDLFSFNPKEDIEFNLSNIDNIYQHHFMNNPAAVKKGSIGWIKLCFISKLKPKAADEYFYYLQLKNKHIKSSKYFISIGGDNYCYGDGSQIARMTKYLHKLGKSVILLGCSIGKNDLNEVKIEDLKSLDLIIARESLTYQNLLDIGVEKSKLYLCHDPAFLLKPEFCSLPEGFLENNTVGINLSKMICSYESDNNKGVLYNSVIKLCDYIINETDMSIGFIPHVIKQRDNDSDILNELMKRYSESKRVCLIDGNLNAEQIKGYIARCRFFVGARTHSTIAAYSSCVPTIALGYSVKSLGIAKDIFGTYDGLVITANDTQDDSLLLNEFIKLTENEKYYKDYLTKAMPEYIKSSEEAGKVLKKMICK